jgi:hypothetical protein
MNFQQSRLLWVQAIEKTDANCKDVNMGFKNKIFSYLLQNNRGSERQKERRKRPLQCCTKE